MLVTCQFFGRAAMRVDGFVGFWKVQFPGYGTGLTSKFVGVKIHKTGEWSPKGGYRGLLISQDESRCIPGVPV